MKKIRVIAATAFFAVALQVTCSASSLLFNIPTVLSVDKYADNQGRTVEEVLKTVEESAKAQLGYGSTTTVLPSVPTVIKPVVEELPIVRPPYLNPVDNNPVSGEQVVIQVINGIPTILKK